MMPGAHAQALPPLYQNVMRQPRQAPHEADRVLRAFRAAADNPVAVLELAGALGGQLPLPVFGGANAHPPPDAADPLAASLAWMSPWADPSAGTWPPALPGVAALPNPLRAALASMFEDMGQAHQSLQRALAGLDPTLTPDQLRRQALEGDPPSPRESDFRHSLPHLDLGALLGGMQQLMAATQRLRHFAQGQTGLPALAWQLDTPLGRVVVDTTGQDNHHHIHHPLLVLDTGGNDHYTFSGTRPSHSISVLLDLGGNDHYRSQDYCADPSCGVLGYGVLWDTAGNDHYQGGQLTQASALFGAAALIDEAGSNLFEASSHAQAHAVAGYALLIGSPGDDQWLAQTHAQASAGPHGVAVLLDPGGNDRYVLNSQPLVRASPQLPDRNTSMGQGAGRGYRARPGEGESLSGGLGLLIDLAGDDHYTADVFAQGAGYYEGLGMLIDAGGADQFNAAWYAMGAAAHRGAGVFIKRGNGNDRYHASHVSALGAAHDESVAVFLDEGGNDTYRLGDLGLGAAHDYSTALFIDQGGDDHYTVDANPCRALGGAFLSGDAPAPTVVQPTLMGVFMDHGGADQFPPVCHAP
ncbi:MAG: hypothetical protein RLZZ401_1499 [Pseudomonadota bacterium]